MVSSRFLQIPLRVPDIFVLQEESSLDVLYQRVWFELPVLLVLLSYIFS